MIRLVNVSEDDYDAYIGDEKVGELRIRNGYFDAKYKGTIEYCRYIHGSTVFMEHEREEELEAACIALLKAHYKGDVGLHYVIDNRGK